MRYLALAALLAGCGAPVSVEEQACNDLIDWSVNIAVRCGEPDRAGLAAELHRQLDCSRVVRLRDREEIYHACYVDLLHVTCSAVEKGGWLPSSCADQLIF